MNEEYQRLRITFSKGENLRYISHLDLTRTWERALRRAGIPVFYSKGYHPHPKMVFASALPVGCTGAAEVMDIKLAQPVPPRRVQRGLVHRLPDGLTVIDAVPVYGRAPSLPALLHGADYEIVVEAQKSIETAREACATLLARHTISKTYRDKDYDLRPLIDQLQIVKAKGPYLLIQMRLAAGNRGTGRPSEVLDALGWSDFFSLCHRRQLRFSVDKS